jgi:hypothetical protein
LYHLRNLKTKKIKSSSSSSDSDEDDKEESNEPVSGGPLSDIVCEPKNSLASYAEFYLMVVRIDLDDKLRSKSPTERRQ